MRDSLLTIARLGRTVLSVGFILALTNSSATAQTWVPTTGSSWATPGNWNPATVPNAVGATATFTAINTANRTITNDSGTAGFTVGAISFDTGPSTFTNSLTTGTANSNLKLNNGGSGVTITTSGTGTGNNTISVPLIFNDTVTANVNQTTSSSAAGSLNLTASITGTGGFIKNGDGLATYGTGAKTYSGATVLNGGRMRISVTARPTATASFTINAGGQLTPIAAGNMTFGGTSAVLNLNGTGATSGSFASFPGAIRADTNLAIVFDNATVLQSNTLLHVQGLTGSLTFTNTISGPGSLTLTAPTSDANQGQLILNGANTYAGGTLVRGGTAVVSGANATFGTGNVTVSNATSPSSTALISISAGVTNAIADTATLSLDGGTAGKADLGASINEVVGALILNGTAQADGTYGATGSGAMNINDTFFTGNGIITVTTPVPEPTSALLVGGGILAAAGWVRRRRAGRDHA